MTITRRGSQNVVWRIVLAVLLVLAIIPGSPRAAAEPFGEPEYAAWLGDHALRLLATLELPSEFTLADLRDLAAELAQLIDQARAVEPPARYAETHAAYLEAIDAVDSVRAGFLTVVLTRQPVATLRDVLFEAGQRTALALRQARAAGIELPAYLAALLGDDEQPGAVAPMAGSLGADSLATVFPGAQATATPSSAAVARPLPTPRGARAPAAPTSGPPTPRPVPTAGLPPLAFPPLAPLVPPRASAPTPPAATPTTRPLLLAAPPTPAARTLAGIATSPSGRSCDGQTSCAASSRLLVRVLAVGQALRAGRDSTLDEEDTMLVLRTPIENVGRDSYVVRSHELTIEDQLGRDGLLVHPPRGVRELVPRAGLLLAPGESREGLLYFAAPSAARARPDDRRGGHGDWRAQLLRIEDTAAAGGRLVVALP
jgi:hypothetical protein